MGFHSVNRDLNEAVSTPSEILITAVLKGSLCCKVRVTISVRTRVRTEVRLEPR
jgi:hypothetical protein